MKIFKITSLVLVLFTSFISCDAIDELTEFDASFSISESIAVGVPADATTFTQSTTLNIAEDEDVADNLSAIENVEVTSLSYTISNVVGNDDAMLTDVTLSAGSIIFSIEDFIPSQVEGQEITISNTAGLSALGDAFRNNTEIVFTMSGTGENGPVSFTATLIARITVTIDVV